MPVASVTPSGQRVLAGAFVNGFLWTSQYQDDFDALVGRRMDIVHVFQPWGWDKASGAYNPDLSRDMLDRAAARGASLMISWEPAGSINGLSTSHAANITAGYFDAYVDSWAQGMAAFGKPVYLRPFHEMNGNWMTWGDGQNGNTAADLIAAWRHIHDRFALAGATNVIWVWSPNIYLQGQPPLSAYYPGDGYVDWVALDGYNGGLEVPIKGGWLTPEQTFGSSLRDLAAFASTKPIMIGETSSAELGGSKAQWITQLMIDLPHAYPNLKAIVWFNFDARADQLNQTDWRVNTSDAALTAYRAALQDPMYALTK